jgi:hypothetical protein
VERKKVEAIAVGGMVLMSGGEIGHHPPAPTPSPELPGNSRLVASTATMIQRVGGYSSSVDIYDSKTGSMLTPPAKLSLARQYFGVAAAGGKAFFGGGFANDPATIRPAEILSRCVSMFCPTNEPCTD